MSSINKKKYFFICLFAVALTLLILLCFAFFLDKSSADMQGIPQVFYFGNSRSEIIFNSPITSEQLYQYFRQSLFQYLPLLIATICFCIILFSGILLYAIKWLDKKHNQDIAQDISHVEEGNIIAFKEPLLNKEYNLIAQKLSSYAEDQYRLHSYIAHEQKNLLMLIKGKTLAGHDINSDLNKMSQSIDDILTLSVHENTQKNLCDLALIVAQEYDNFHSVYHNMYFDYDEDANYMILGKEKWLRRALHNLIDNAIKYGNHKCIDVYLKQMHNSVLLYVQDHGEGISEEEQERIFDYSYRIQEQKKDGYGIGLSLVSHVCDLCDGFIRVKSIPKQGTTFILSFPCINNDS